MGDVPATTLTIQQVTDLIGQAMTTSAASPLLIGIKIFDALGDDVILTGDTLRPALTTSGIQFGGPFALLVNAIVQISKVRDHVAVVLDEPIETVLTNSKTHLRFDKNVSFDVSPGEISSSFSNITGFATHVLFAWPNITNIQLSQNQGHLTVAVTVGGFKKSFPIQ